MPSCGNINVKTMQECNYDTKDLQKCGISKLVSGEWK